MQTTEKKYTRASARAKSNSNPWTSKDVNRISNRRVGGNRASKSFMDDEHRTSKIWLYFHKGEKKKKKIKSSYSEMEEDRENRVQEFQALVENELVGRCN